MPVWSQQEIFKCRELVYSDLPVAVVQDCFRRWGGITRYALWYAQLDDQQVLLGNTIGIVDVNWLVDACGKLDVDDAKVSHRLLHYRVSKHFISASDGIGALAVLRGHLFEGRGAFRIRRLIDNGEAHDNDEYLTEGEGEGDDDAMNVEDDVAMEDSTGATRDHGDGAISFQLSERPTDVFNNDNEVIAADTTIYLRPAAKNYKSVDAISKPDVLF
ncbi:hypothetical protein JG687_00014907 [Phytophthora cactorum]|uniref:Uncharacterized protein n=1 Tax=Phytophthora cactorum TaxID=29920 RepID=A0A8T1TZG2_9STRA|nr:hypothetical protein JG687_00014907 [Phytophthora cactorum]